ncbi:MAG: TolC family protein, partial [Clostridium sp.]|nr:TolC family protein [Clostridium sp.]
ELKARLLQYQAALESYTGAELVYKSQKRRQAAGMLSNTEYLQGEADYAKSKAAKETASMNLVQAYESYCWEVKGIG